MNKREMAQACYRADLIGLPIVAWSAQTKRGAHWLGVPEWTPCKVSAVNLPVLVDCPACGGRTSRNEHGVAIYCPVCDGTGRTTRGHEKNWADWQIEAMQKRAGLIAA